MPETPCQDVVEEDVFARAHAGNADAIAKLLLKYGPAIRARLAINPRWRSSLDVEDVMQVTYLEAFLRIRQLRTLDADTFTAWLSRVAENNLRDAIKELERDKRPDPRQRVRSEDSFAALADLISSSTYTGSRYASREEMKHILEDAISKLPAVYQRVVRMCDLDGKSPQEAAAVIGRSVGAVKMLRSRAHDRLRELLGSASEFAIDVA